MPLHIPLTVYPSLSSNSINATFSSHSSPSSSPSSSSSSNLIEERFIPPTSSQGVWIRIKGYTQHLSPIGQRYARELPNKIGTEANQYIETLLEDREGVLKVEALKDGKVLAVVNSRLSKEEEEVFYKFRRSTSTPTSPRPTASTSTSTSREEDGVRRSSWVNRRTDEDGRIRFNRRTIIQNSPSDEEDDDDEEDYSDLPPLVSLAPGESFYSTSPSPLQTTEPQPSLDSPQDYLSFLFTPPTLPSRSDRFNHVLPPPPPTHAPIRARDHLFYSHPNSSSYLPPAPATASTIDNDNEDDEEGSTDAMVEERIERARLYGEPMDEVEDTRERRRMVAEETVVLRSMNRYTGWPSSRTVGRETVGR